MTKKSILFISSYEICYNPRLVKAADFMYEKGWDVYVITPQIGVADTNVFNDFIARRTWQVKIINITKSGIKNYLRWAYVSLLCKLYEKKFPKIRNNAKLYLMNKALYAFNFSKIPKTDVVYINLVNNLPLAAKIKQENKATKLVYDSQEFFTGQYSNSNGFEPKWVKWAEDNFIKEADIVCTTTNVMKEKLVKKYQLKNTIRLRNLPYKANDNIRIDENYSELRLIWHGLSIYYNSRGVNILIDAVAKCDIPVRFVLQGNINTEQKIIINKKLSELKIEDKVEIKPAASPDEILESLKGYHIGLIGEMPLEDNQKLTSSNKLFDYIQSGMAVIVTDLPGLAETINEYKCGELYPSGDSDRLAQILTELYNDKERLNVYRKNAISTSKELIWKKDFDNVFNVIS